MREIIADSRMMHIGKNGEGDALQVAFPVVAEWEALYGAGGVWTLNVQRFGDALAYAAQDFTIKDGAALWVVTDADAAVVGEGRCELTYKIGDTVAKSRTYSFRVDRSLTGGGDVPDPVKGWQEALEERVDGKLDRPDGGSAGDVLTKTGDGEEWKTMQSDWNEFDSTKPGYIKNKPFYTGLENQTYDKVVDMSASKYVDVGVSDFTLYEGTKYTVTWDGKKYESTCESDYGILHIGNFALYDIAPFSKTDTGEPFCVIYDGNTNQIIGEKSGASHQIVMLYGIPTVHMLSPAYIGVQSKSNYMSDDSGRVQYLATPDGNYELVVPEIPNIKNALNGLSEKRIATFEMTAEQLDAVSSNEYTEIKTNANIAVSGYNPNNLQSYYVDLLVGGKRYKVLPIDDDSSTANFVFETEQFGLPVRTYCIRIENRSYKQKIIRLDQNALNEKKFIFKQQAVADAGKVLTVGDDGKVVASGGGLSYSEKNLMLTLFKSIPYTSDVNATINSLSKIWNGTATYYSIEYNLTRITVDNEVYSIAEGGTLEIELDPDTATEITSITVTMSGIDVTSTAYANNKITINPVQGDIVITAVATSTAYTAIEYIQGDGTAWINTGYSPAAGDLVEMEFAATETNWDYVFSSYKRGSALYGFVTRMAYTIGTSTGFTRRMATDSSRQYNDRVMFTCVANTKYKLKETTAGTATLYNAAGEGLLTMVDEQASTFAEPTNPIFLLAQSNGDTPVGKIRAKEKIYKFTIIDAYGNKKLDLIPVLDSDGVACLYDKVSKKFIHDAAGGNTFIAGGQV